MSYACTSRIYICDESMELETAMLLQNQTYCVS